MTLQSSNTNLSDQWITNSPNTGVIHGGATRYEMTKWELTAAIACATFGMKWKDWDSPFSSMNIAKGVIQFLPQIHAAYEAHRAAGRLP